MKRAEATQKEALEHLLGLGSVCDTQRVITTLGDAGHQVDEKRARQLFRDLATAGSLAKTQDRPVQYRTTGE
ncbi:hypothetical protein OG285_31485 [Streptomyces sp. NBC_01471]|uniref:hypothetical protein n=1 Tax=Streptomyces sp. NBC_01471 TaxID=2903879 RepID=UPI0032469252